MTIFDIIAAADCLIVPYALLRLIRGESIHNAYVAYVAVAMIRHLTLHPAPGTGPDASSLEAAVCILGCGLGVLVITLAQAVERVSTWIATARTI